MHRGGDYGETSRTFSRNVTFRVYLVRPKVRSMSAAFRMYLLHLDNDLSCIGSARARSVAPFRMHLLYLNSVPDKPAHRSPREGRRLLDAGCDRFCCSISQVTAVLSRAQSCTDSSAAVALVASKSVIFVSLPM